jgi:hypothetical protein
MESTKNDANIVHIKLLQRLDISLNSFSFLIGDLSSYGLLLLLVNDR